MWYLLQVKKKKFNNKSQETIGNSDSPPLQTISNELNKFNGKMRRTKISRMNASKNNARPYNKGENNRFQHIKKKGK